MFYVETKTKMADLTDVDLLSFILIEAKMVGSCVTTHPIQERLWITCTKENIFQFVNEKT